jgi:putative intracellular protease/amidase
MAIRMEQVPKVKAVPRILMPLPDNDFDPTEASIPWEACIAQGWNVDVTTELGSVPQADAHKLKGPLPGLLSAGSRAKAAYHMMAEDAAYQHPIVYEEIDASQYDALLLPGGDGLGVRQYLDSQVLQGKVFEFYRQGKLIGAICHGVLVLARTIDPTTAQSILYGHKVATVPKSLDRVAFLFDSWFLRHGYVMYSCCVEDEVRACLKSTDDLSMGSGLFTPHVVCDGALVTSRWYLDAELFAKCFTSEMEKRVSQRSRSSE